MRSQFSLGNSEALKSPHQKREINREMFAIIAPRYRWITQILSFGQDRYWKQDLIDSLPKLVTPFCLDLACGPGDISLLLAARYPQGQVMGLDICPNMLNLARKNQPPPHLHYVLADMQSPPIPNHCIDVVTGGYALRNAPDLDVLLQVIYQKLKPKGVASFLDFSRPMQPKKARLQAKLLRFWTRWWGFCFHGNADVYGYIAESLALFPNVEDLQHRILAAGFTNFSRREYLGGFTALVQFQKP